MKKLVLCALAFVLAAAPAAARNLELADYLNFEQAADPQVSPDGRRVLFTRVRVDKMKDTLATEVWQMDADGSRARFLVKGGGARWSPSGDRIAYIGVANGAPQLFVRWMDAEGATSQVTHDIYKPNAFAWSPDGETIAFRAEIPLKPGMSIALPGRPPGAKWTADPAVIDKLHYRIDRVGLKTGYNHLFVVPASGGTPRQLTEGEWDVGRRFYGIDAEPGGAISWDANSKSIVFSADMTEDSEAGGVNARIYRLDVASKEITPLVEDEGSWGLASVSPDGKQIVYMGNRPSPKAWPATELRIMNADGSNNRLLRGNIDSPFITMQWAADSRGLLAQIPKEGSQNVEFIGTNGQSRSVTSGAQVLSIGSATRNTIFGVVSSPTVSPNVVSVSVRNGAITQLTDLNADIFHDVDLADYEEIWYDSSDDTRVHGWIVRPPDFDAEKEYPLLLLIHGGPQGMYNVGFSFRFQEYAARGYVVVFTNPRGSTGYGYEFTDAIDNAYPGRVDFDDLMAGVDATIARGNIDEERLYVSGCSGGGALTAWVVGHTDRFAAAASLCPVINWISMAGTADVAGWAQKQYRSTYYEDPQLWIEHSPLFHVSKVTTPTLLITGDKDLRTPLAQAEEFYAALKKQGVPTMLIPMKNEWHGTWSIPSNLLRTQLYIQQWFDTHGGGTNPETEEEAAE